MSNLIKTVEYTGYFVAFGMTYYYVLAKVFDKWVLHQVLKTRWAQNYPVNQLNSLVNIIVAGIMQFLLLIVLSFMFPIAWKNLLLTHFKPIHILFGLLLGAAEMATANFLVIVMMTSLAFVGSSDIKNRLKGWKEMSYGGWINFFKISRENSNGYIIVLLIIFHIVIEELLFRGIVLQTYFQIEGIPYSVVLILPTLLFVLAQLAGMPSLWHAFFPMCSALVMGFVHNWLLLKVASIIPLIVAHITYFYLSVLLIPKTSTNP